MPRPAYNTQIQLHYFSAALLLIGGQPQLLLPLQRLLSAVDGKVLPWWQVVADVEWFGLFVACYLLRLKLNNQLANILEFFISNG